MARYMVKGVERRTGDFKNDRNETVEYDNILLHCLVVHNSPLTKSTVLAGCKTDVIKIKNDFQNLVYTERFPIANFGDLVGCEIELYQNSDGKIECVAVVSVDAER